MSNIANVPITKTETNGAITERKEILQSLHLALTDMGKIIYRQQGSSNDHSLFPIEFMDIISLLCNYPSIHTIILSGSKQGNSSLQWFSIFCDLNGIPFNPKKLDKATNIIINICGRAITIVKGLSTSRQSRIMTDELIKHYRSILTDTKT
jgi:hypothetical protein